MEKSNGTFVISNYNSDPSWLIGLCNHYVIYEQSDNLNFKKNVIEKYPDSINYTNAGHNIGNNMHYIYNNYANLPKIIGFIKSTSVPRHCDEEHFHRIYANEYFTPIFNNIEKKDLGWQSIQGLLSEYNDSWYSKMRPHRYFCTANQLLEFVFKSPIIPKYVNFVPGANMIVESTRIAKYPPELYWFLEYITTYAYFPSEAYIVERLLPYIYFSDQKIESHMYSRESILKALERRQLNGCHCSVSRPMKRIIQGIGYRLDSLSRLVREYDQNL